MAGKKKPASMAGLTKTRSQIERWRKSRKKLGPMPEGLWEAAVRLARTHGLNPVAEALHLNYYALKRRVNGRSAVSAKRKRPRPAFVQVDLAPPVSLAGWTLEVEDPRGLKLKIHSGGAGDLDAVALTEAILQARA